MTENPSNANSLLLSLRMRMSRSSNSCLLVNDISSVINIRTFAHLSQTLDDRGWVWSPLIPAFLHRVMPLKSGHRSCVGSAQVGNVHPRNIHNFTQLLTKHFSCFNISALAHTSWTREKYQQLLFPPNAFRCLARSPFFDVNFAFNTVMTLS